MPDYSLLIICFNAFVAVLTLLSILAFGMRGLTLLFPVPTADSDPTVTAAVAAAVSATYPGARVTRMELVSGDKKR